MRANVSYALLTGILGTSAMAADLPSRKLPVAIAMPAAMTWTGCYVGGFVGLDIAQTRVRRDTVRTTAPVLTGGAVDAAATLLATSTPSRSNDTGGDVGGRVGCNYQVSRLVLGLQAEGGYLGIRSTANDPLRPTAFTDTQGGAYGALVGRIGYAFEAIPLHVYARGGGAITDLRFRDTDFALYPFGVQSRPNGIAGLVGAGAEYRINENLSVTLDYSYLRTSCASSNNLFFTPVVVPLTAGTATVTGTNTERTRACVDKHMISMGLNYYFGSAAPVPVVARY